MTGEHPNAGPTASDGALQRRLARATGPEGHADTTYDGVAARVERRAARRRTGLSALGTVAALTLVGGGLFAATRSGQTNATAASSAGGVPASVSASRGASRPTAEAAAGQAPASGGYTLFSQDARCPVELPSTVPGSANLSGDLADRLVADAARATALICAYPLRVQPYGAGPSAAGPSATGPTSDVAPGLSASREVTVEGSWLASVGALPAASDAAPAGGAAGGRGCASTPAGPASAAATGVYLVRLDYGSNSVSWLRVAVGGCGVAADNGKVSTRQAQRLVEDVRTAYETGTPLR